MIATLSVAQVASVGFDEAPTLDLCWRPRDPLEKLARLDFERSCKLRDGIDAGHPFAALQLPNRSAVQGGAYCRLFLG